MTVFKPARGERQIHVAPEDPDEQVWHGRKGRKAVTKLVKEGKAPGEMRMRTRFEDVLLAAILTVSFVALCIGVAIVVQLVEGG